MGGGRGDTVRAGPATLGDGSEGTCSGSNETGFSETRAELGGLLQVRKDCAFRL